ncbi:unnamed protein product, partial [Mesorhabditis spiculigera]
MSTHSEDVTCYICSGKPAGYVHDPGKVDVAYPLCKAHARRFYEGAGGHEGCRRPALETYKCIGLAVYLMEERGTNKEVLASLRDRCCCRCTFMLSPLEALQRGHQKKE